MVEKRWEREFCSPPRQAEWTKPELAWINRVRRAIGSKPQDVSLRVVDENLVAARPGAEPQALAVGVIPYGLLDGTPDDDEIGCEYCREGGRLAIDGVCPKCDAQWFEEEGTP